MKPNSALFTHCREGVCDISKSGFKFSLGPLIYTFSAGHVARKLGDSTHSRGQYSEGNF